MQVQQPLDSPAHTHNPSVEAQLGLGGLLVLILPSLFPSDSPFVPTGSEHGFLSTVHALLACLVFLGAAKYKSQDTPCKVGNGWGGVFFPRRDKQEAENENEMPHARRGWPGQIPSHLYWS